MDAVHLAAQQVDAPVVRVQIVADMAQRGGIGLAPDCLPRWKIRPLRLSSPRSVVMPGARPPGGAGPGPPERRRIRHPRTGCLARGRTIARAPGWGAGIRSRRPFPMWGCRPARQCPPGRARHWPGVSAQRVVRLVRRVPAIGIVHARDGPDGVAATQQRFAVRTNGRQPCMAVPDSSACMGTTPPWGGGTRPVVHPCRTPSPWRWRA